MEISKFSEFDHHEQVTYVYDKDSGLRGFIAVHRKNSSYPSLGATRLWNYASESEALRDALRLSRLMSYKSALAGLKYGGAKAALIVNEKALKSRKLFFNSYANRLNRLGGSFVTGTDVGVKGADIKSMGKKTPYVIGTHVDPAFYTAIGIHAGIQSALRAVYGSDSIRGRVFAIQGVGKVGANILKLLYPEAKSVFIADIDTDKIRKIKKRFPRVKVKSSNDIVFQKVDVFVPNALSGIINHVNIAKFRCSIIAGSANNQLENEYMGNCLHQRGILYAPDYAINAGGIISVADELENKKPDNERILRRARHIGETLSDIFTLSKKKNIPTNIIADRMARDISSFDF